MTEADGSVTKLTYDETGIPLGTETSHELKQDVVRGNVMISDTLSIAFVILILSTGGALIAYILRVLVHCHAFDGMSKSHKKKVIKRQIFIRRLLMFYTTKSNPTKCYSPIGTWWCLICYYIFLVNMILFLSAAILSIFFEFDFHRWIESLRIAGISVVFSLLSHFLPLKKKMGSR